MNAERNSSQFVHPPAGLKKPAEQSVHSQVSAMNAATAQMVRFLLNQYLKNLKKYYVRLFYCFRMLCQFVLSIVGDVDRAR